MNQLDFSFFSDPLRGFNWKNPEDSFADQPPSYTCPLCDKHFTARASLDRHFLIHTGKKDFICSLCKRAFSRKDALRRHMIYHMADSDSLKLS